MQFSFSTVEIVNRISFQHDRPGDITLTFVNRRTWPSFTMSSLPSQCPQHGLSLQCHHHPNPDPLRDVWKSDAKAILLSQQSAGGAGPVAVHTRHLTKAVKKAGEDADRDEDEDGDEDEHMSDQKSQEFDIVYDDGVWKPPTILRALLCPCATFGMPPPSATVHLPRAVRCTCIL